MRPYSILLAALLALAAVPAAAQNAETGKVLEGAIVNFDPATDTWTAKVCRRCKALVLKTTAETYVRVKGQRVPLTPDTEIGGLVDTMYRPEDMTVIWFQPLTIRR